MLDRWLVYGSPSSVDCDVFVPLDQEVARRLSNNGTQTHRLVDVCADLQRQLIESGDLAVCKAQDRKISVNVGVADWSRGVLLWSLKGDADETNNVLLAQYEHHAALQKHALYIREVLPPNLPRRTMHTLRAVLGVLARTQHRVVCKRALKGTVQDKCAALRQIALEDVRFALNADRSPIETWKQVAYKVGHVLALQRWRRECCSKEDVAVAFPELSVFLARHSASRAQLIQLTQIVAHFLDETDHMVRDDPNFGGSRETLVWF